LWQATDLKLKFQWWGVTEEYNNRQTLQVYKLIRKLLTGLREMIGCYHEFLILSKSYQLGHNYNQFSHLNPPFCYADLINQREGLLSGIRKLNGMFRALAKMLAAVRQLPVVLYRALLTQYQFTAGLPSTYGLMDIGRMGSIQGQQDAKIEALLIGFHDKGDPETASRIHWGSYKRQIHDQYAEL
jgi:hypothetical protein